MTAALAPYALNTRDAEVLRLVQITDCHLYEGDDGQLLGLKTAESFNAVIDDITLHAPADAVLATGDLSQDETAGSYQRLKAGVKKLSWPTFWLPGNHDDPELMAKELQGDNLHAHKHLISKHWQVILLNSHVKRRVYGKLSDDELKFLESSLQRFPDHHALVVLHHHPVPIECFWLDTIGLNNPEAVFDLLARHGKKTVLLWGHVHQKYDGEKDGVRLLSTPSTCVQFKPHSQDFQADSEPPGYRFLDLHPDGRVDTQLKRIEHIAFTIDYSVKGY